MDNLTDTLVKIIRTLDKGIIMERNARNFYAAAARVTKSDEGRKLFEWLANFEVGHKHRLEAKREEILHHPALEGVEIQALGEYKVSEADWNPNLSDNSSDQEILKLALENEKRAYTFFQKKITIAQDELMKQLFETLAREEEKHMEILNEQLKSITMKDRWVTFEEIERLLPVHDGEGI